MNDIIWDIGGEVVKSDSRYVVTDNTELNNLVVSSTKLNAKKTTTGHRHRWQRLSIKTSKLQRYKPSCRRMATHMGEAT